jgi:hypothetical protein
LDCESIAFATGEAARSASSFDSGTKRIFAGGNAVKLLLAVRWSNYASVDSMGLKQKIMLIRKSYLIFFKGIII